MLNYTFSLRGVAQGLARMVWDHEVGGSNPLTPTIIQIPQLYLFLYGIKSRLMINTISLPKAFLKTFPTLL